MKLIRRHSREWIVALALMVRASAAIREPGDIFADVPVWRVSVTISPENAARLKTNPRNYVAADVRILDGLFREVGVHLKGSTGSFRGIGEKPSLTLNFSKYLPANKFHGLAKVHLNNSVEDPSYLNEQLGAEIFRTAGVPAPRVTHALVDLNGRELGLYVVKEGFSEDFLERNFAQSTGNFYEPAGGGDVGAWFKRHSGVGPDTQEDLASLAKAISVTDLSERWRQFGQILDTDRFITFMAIEILIGHRDGYCLARNNFRIYYDPQSGKFVFLPTGMDQLFGKADTPWKPQMAGSVAKAMMEIPEVRRLYSERFAKLLNDVLLPGRLSEVLNSHLESLRDDISKNSFESLKIETDALCHRLYERKYNLARQLAQPQLTPLVFTNHHALLDGWKQFDEPSGGGFQTQTSATGGPLLIILAGPVTSASWRTTVLLRKGSYDFEGKASAESVAPLPFGNNQGARLRIGGRNERSSGLLGTSGWSRLQLKFEVKSPEEEVELICELRGSAGKAVFERNSLKLTISD